MHTAVRLMLPVLLLAGLQTASAEQVYTWTDLAGVTHFSQLPPPPGVGAAQQLDLPPYRPVLNPEDDYYSVINQAARMEERRLERERLEAERRQAEAEALRARTEAQAARDAATAPPAPVYVPWYPARSWPAHPHHGRYPQRKAPYGTRYWLEYGKHDGHADGKAGHDYSVGFEHVHKPGYPHDRTPGVLHRPPAMTPAGSR